MFINKNKFKKIISSGLVLTSLLPSYSQASVVIDNPINNTFNIYPVYSNDNIIGFYIKCKDNSYKYVNSFNYGINKDIDSDNMVFNLDEIDLNNIYGCNIYYNNDDVFMIYDNNVIKLMLFNNKVGTTNNKYMFNKNLINKDIHGIEFDYSNDELMGIYVKKINGSLGYVNVSGKNNNKFNLITCLDDIDTSSLVNCKIDSIDGNVFIDINVIDGSVYRIYLDLIDKEYNLDNMNHDRLKNIHCYYLDDFKVDLDYKDRVVGIYLKTIDNNFKYVSVINTNSNYNIDYSDIICNDYINKVNKDDKTVGIMIKRRDGKYDYVGVSPEFDYDYYDKLNDISYCNDIRDSVECISVKDFIIGNSKSIKLYNKKYLFNIVSSFYGSSDYYELVIYFNDLDRKNSDIIYLPSVNELIRYYNMFNENKEFHNKVIMK